jgi:hypothetical protein
MWRSLMAGGETSRHGPPQLGTRRLQPRRERQAERSVGPVIIWQEVTWIDLFLQVPPLWKGRAPQVGGL